MLAAPKEPQLLVPFWRASAFPSRAGSSLRAQQLSLLHGMASRSAELPAQLPAGCGVPAWPHGQDPTRDKGRKHRAQPRALVLRETLDTSNSQLQIEAILTLVSSLT